jgi:WD40 repeat protein
MDSGSGRIVYAISNIIVIRDLANLDHCTVFDQHKSETTAVRISANGNLCASGDSTGNVIVWELRVDHHPVSKTFENVLGGPVRDISWTGDG